MAAYHRPSSLVTARATLGTEVGSLRSGLIFAHQDTGKQKRKAWAPKQFLEIRTGKGTLKRDHNAMELSVSAAEKLDITGIVNAFGMAERLNGLRGRVPIKKSDLIVPFAMRQVR